MRAIIKERKVKDDCFAVNIEHSQQIVEEYCREGIAAEHIDANTPKKEREQILKRFRKGETLVLSNVDIVSEGFDVPDCEAVQLARPTKSLALFLQQVGRCMRPSPGKEEGLVLDNAGLWLEHGFCQQDRICFLSFALNKGHKPYSAYLRFEEQYLSENNQNLNLIHLKYIQNRISRLPGAPNQGTWYHIKKNGN